MARLTSLKVEDFKKIILAEISPEGNVTVVGGLNESGKSSLLDSISVLLQGKAVKIKEPVRKGTKKAKIAGTITSDEWDAFDDLHITRTISKAGNWSLKINGKSGTEAMLRKIFGDPLDPSEFIRMDPKKRFEVLKKMMGLDFDELDEKRQKLYSDRTLVNQKVADQKANLDAMEVYLDVPDEDLSVSDLVKELEQMRVQNSAKEKLELELRLKKEEITSAENRIRDMQTELDALTKKMKNADDFVGRLIDDQFNLLGEIENHQSFDIDTVQKVQIQIGEVEKTNNQIRANQTYTIDLEIYEKNKIKSENMTSAIDDIDLIKNEQLEKADFPVDGLSFTEDDVLYNDLPFDENQLSSEELLKVSFAMAIASDPALKVILMRYGAFLDKNNLKLISRMAEDANIHAFIEVNEDNASKTTIIIENGRIKDDFDNI